MSFVPERPNWRFIQCCGITFVGEMGVFREEWYSRKPVQNRSCVCFPSDNAVCSALFAAPVIVLVHSFGFEIILNFVAATESAIRQSSTSKPKKLKRSSVISFSQSRAARCSSVNLAAIHTIVTAFRPAPYVRSCPRWVWSVRSS